MSAEPHAPLTEAELLRDSHDSYYDAMRAIGAQVRAGEPLHPLHTTLFRPREGSRDGEKGE